MRTTVTLDSDVVALLNDRVHRERRSFKQVLNDAVRAGLRNHVASQRAPIELRVHHATLNPGIDGASFNRLSDELAVEDFIDRR